MLENAGPPAEKIAVGGNFFTRPPSISTGSHPNKRLTACLKECCMMKRTLSALMLSGALLCALSVPALLADAAAPQTDTLPDPGGDPSRTACCATAL